MANSSQFHTKLAQHTSTNVSTWDHVIHLNSPSIPKRPSSSSSRTMFRSRTRFRFETRSTRGLDSNQLQRDTTKNGRGIQGTEAPKHPKARKRQRQRQRRGSKASTHGQGHGPKRERASGVVLPTINPYCCVLALERCGVTCCNRNTRQEPCQRHVVRTAGCAPSDPKSSIAS